MFLITQVNYLNKSETEVELEIRFIASPIKFDIVKISILEAFYILSWLSFVSVTTNFLISDLLIFLTASPLNTPWVTYT